MLYTKLFDEIRQMIQEGARDQDNQKRKKHINLTILLPLILSFYSPEVAGNTRSWQPFMWNANLSYHLLRSVCQLLFSYAHWWNSFI